MADLKKDELLDMYYDMVLIRRFEETCAALYQEGKIGGFLHLYIGQEATGVGAVRALRDEDHVITAYRDHGIAIARQLDVNALMAEMLGKRNGVSGGKGGSMHLASREHNYWGGYAIVGGHLPLASGIALRARYMEEDFGVLCLMGDGSTNIGYFHESLNLSAVWDLPVVWLVENNQYGMGTTVERASGVAEIVKKAHAYGMKEGPRADGMDVIAVYDAVKEAMEYARQTGPVLMEALTYRFMGHSMGDPERYRTKDEVRQYRDDDPIGKFGNYLTGKRKVKQETLDDLDKRAAEAIEAAVQFAEESPDPTAEDLFANIYVEEA
ncbi:MAG: pyruvate dehydrogenase (acetyl-transferring) E1 component subunit alpha [Chloroflexi bacterium]|nr:pyruvate dehydrogenase (acetyl-transferring) E1 component subunit alpha [Chloroflexota bacterium]